MTREREIISLPLSEPQRIGPEEPETWRCYRRPPCRRTSSPRARRPRRAVNYDDSEPDDDDEDLELGPPDADGGWA